MNFRTFFGFNVLGGALWVGLLLAAGYGLGSQPFVHDHLTAVLLAIVALSLLPGLFEWIKQRRGAPSPASD
jgi:membrane-associated protein